MNYLSVSIGYTLCEKEAAAGMVEMMANDRRFDRVYVQNAGVTRAAVLKRDVWFSQRPQPCLAPPGSHPGLWIAPSEPDRRWPIPLARRPTGPPTRRWEGCRTSGQSMAPMTQTEEEEEEGDSWVPDPRVRDDCKHRHIFSVKKNNRRVF